MIHQAAILYDGTIYTLARPARHHDIIRHIHAERGDYGPRLREQGFTCTGVDRHGRRLPAFVRRAPARRIAELAGQLLPTAKDLRELYSEDVW